MDFGFQVLDSGFQSARFGLNFQQLGCRTPIFGGIPDSESWIPEPRIPDSTSENFLDSGIRITLHGLTSEMFTPKSIASVKIIEQSNGCFSCGFTRSIVTNSLTKKCTLKKRCTDVTDVKASLQSMAELDEISRVQSHFCRVHHVQYHQKTRTRACTVDGICLLDLQRPRAMLRFWRAQ